MAKYDGQITEAKNLLPNAKNILVALPVASDIDKFAAGLALFLSLKATGKQVSIVCEDTVLVAQAHLFGVDNIQKNIALINNGNFVITLGGVALPDPTSPNGWKVPSLENLDWYGEAGNLNLVFHVIPGQNFQPTSVTPHSQGSGLDLIFVIGSPDLNSLGSIYAANQQVFSGTHIANIDNHQINTGFGVTNVLDQNVSSVSEMMADLIPSLGLPFDADMASNLLAGIFDATANLTGNVGADTFLAVAQCLRVGGKRPGQVMQPQPAGFDLSALMPRQPEPMTPPPVQNEFPTPPVVSQNLAPETPQGEATNPGMEIEAEPDWLTPKIFKAGQG